MIFDEIPYELKERIFNYVTPDDWINTAKVSNEWLELTLTSIKKVYLCQALILDHMAEFINQQKNTSYTWVSLLALMPNLEYLECCENIEYITIWDQLNPPLGQVKNSSQFDWKHLNSWRNLSEFEWRGCLKSGAFPLKVFELAPKLKSLTIQFVEITAEWKKKIPKSVKHIFIHNVRFVHPNQCSINDLCEDSSTLETFSASHSLLTMSAATQFFEETPHLKYLELQFINSKERTLMILENALRKCICLQIVKACNLTITDNWRRIFPENVESINVFAMKVQENMRSDFALDWLFQNYGHLQSLELRSRDWTGLDFRKFYSTENLKKLYLDSYASIFVAGHHESMDIFSDICVRMIRGSRLVYVEVCGMTIDESWRHIFPPTIKRLKLKDFRLSKEAELVFSPQFICENPTNIESLILENFDGELPAMNLNAFSGMQGMQKLHLTDLRISGECLQSILTHCSALTDLFIGELTAGALTNIPHNLVLPSLRKLGVKEPVDESSLLLQHFNKLHTVYIAIVPPEAPFLAILNGLQVAETVELRMGDLSWDRLCCLVQSLDEIKFKYFCLSVVQNGWKEISFHWTNSLVDACSKLDDIIISGVNHDVLWINNYHSSPLLSNVHTIPSSMHELSYKYHEIMEKYYEDYDEDYNFEYAIDSGQNWSPNDFENDDE